MKRFIAATRSRRVTRAVAALLCLVGLTMFSMAVPTDSERAGAFRWARSLSASERAAFSGSLASLPFEYRRALAVTLRDPASKADLWREYFRQYRQTHSLTASQEAVLVSIEQRISTKLLELPESKEASAEIDDIRATVFRNFSDAVAKEILDGGPRTANFTGLPLAERTRHWWRVTRTSGFLGSLAKAFGPVLLHAAGPMQCNCHQSNGDDDCYNPNPECYEDAGTSIDCEETAGGCGPAPQFNEPCDGFCANPMRQ